MGICAKLKTERIKEVTGNPRSPTDIQQKRIPQYTALLAVFRFSHLDLATPWCSHIGSTGSWQLWLRNTCLFACSVRCSTIFQNYAKYYQQREINHVARTGMLCFSIVAVFTMEMDGQIILG